MKRRKYVPDLVGMGATFDGNFQRILKLLRLTEGKESIEIPLNVGSRYVGKVKLNVIETTKYTDTILLEQVAAAGKWLNDPRMTVRIYHDASVAEVISSHGHTRVEGANDYPNRFMHHPDEKSQLNTFLAEWLSFVLTYGCCETVPFRAGNL